MMSYQQAEKTEKNEARSALRKKTRIAAHFVTNL